MDGSSVYLTTDESSATNFYFADATEFIDFSIASGSDFNPGETDWQTNTHAAYPVDQGTGEVSWHFEESQFFNQFYNDVDENYQSQFGASESASSAAATRLSYIETALSSQNTSLRYDADVYLTFRENLLSHEFGALDVYNAVLGERTVAHVYFTNAQDDEGNYHPFMVIGSHDATAGPNFLIDVPKPPGDGQGGTYEEQTITRNAILEHKLVKIPLRDYGNVTALTDNDLSEYSSLAQDQNLDESEWDTYNYASISSTGIAANGVVIYPASNDQLAFATAAAEITSTGAHVGQGMGLHYHAALTVMELIFTISLTMPVTPIRRW